MSKYVIKGGAKLYGEVQVEKAKNTYLPILAAAMLCDGEVVLKDCPKFLDISNMFEIMQHLGAKITKQDNEIVIDSSVASGNYVPVEMAKKLRSSIYMLGALIGKFGKCRVTYPGGCDIGLRPIDLHLKGLRDMGVVITEYHGVIECDADNKKNSRIYLDFPSFGATVNLILASAKGKAKVSIYNCAREPEIVDLCDFINAMGGKISGAGSGVVTVDGVTNLHGVCYSPIGDRIIAGTYLIAGAMTGGEITVSGANPQHLESLINKLRNSGCFIRVKSDKISLKAPKRLKSFGFVETQPYPGFPTDLQSQVLAMQTISRGCCVIQENLYESRFRFVSEIIKMGAKVRASNSIAIVEGVNSLSGAEVYAKELRGGVSLVLAGLCAKGITTVNDTYHIERGYSELHEKLKALGAEITKI